MGISTDIKYGRLKYLNESKIEKGRRKGKFRCDCGNTKYIRIDAVDGGLVRSCGCLYAERRNPFGLDSVTYEKLFGVWSNMMKRCYNQKSERYYAYGLRGIALCDEWGSNFRTFAEWAVDNGWNPSLSIERLDLNGNYEPNNCTFVTMREQARNKTSNIRVIHNGQDKCIAEWCEILGLNDKRIYARYERGIRSPSTLFYPGDLRSLRRVS